MKFEVVSAAFYPSLKSIAPFLESCNRYALKPTLYGIGGKWKSFCQNKVTLLLKQLKHMRSDIVLYIDSNDALFQCGESGLLEAYEKVSGGKGLVISGDAACWPTRELKPWFFERCSSEAMFPFLCAGSFMGGRIRLIEALRVVQRLWRQGRESVSPILQDDDQCWWEKAIVQEGVPCKIDSNGILVASMNHLKRCNDYSISKNRLTLRTGVTPSIIHFNGASKKILKSILYKKEIIA